MKKVKITYLLVVALVALAFVLQWEWLVYAAFAFLLVIILLNAKKATGRPLPPGMAKPFQARPPALPAAPAAPKKKKKIKRPIIIIQPPPRAQSLTHEILEESVKRSFPPFMTPQEKRRLEAERAEKEELMRLLREQSKQIAELKEEIEGVPSYKRRKRYGEDEEE
ncbi:MAG: hypothetical protein QW343_02055 [Candidatus Norongarragalinales archaeon]